MGYWATNAEGHSFTDDESGEMMWGDAPADAMDDALEEIIKAFRADLGRAPSLGELKAGLLFSAQAALDAEQKKRVTEGLYTFAVCAEWSFLNLDGEPIVSQEYEYVDAHDVDEARQFWDAAEEKRREWYQRPTSNGKTLQEEMGMEVKFLSIEQIEPTRRELTLVGKAKK